MFAVFSVAPFSHPPPPLPYQLSHLISVKLYPVAGRDYRGTHTVHIESRGAQFPLELQDRAAWKVQVALHFLEGGAAIVRPGGEEGRVCPFVGDGDRSILNRRTSKNIRTKQVAFPSNGLSCPAGFECVMSCLFGKPGILINEAI